MRTDLVMLGCQALQVAVPETPEELLAGWRMMPAGLRAMLFDLRPFAPIVPLWVPIAVGKDAEPLDVVWCEHGIVTAIATIRAGCLQGFSDQVLELPADFCADIGIHVGDRLVVGNGARGH